MSSSKATKAYIPNPQWEEFVEILLSSPKPTFLTLNRESVCNKRCQSVRKGRAGIAASVDANSSRWATETEKRLLTSGIQYSLYELVLTSCSRFPQGIHVNVVFGSYIEYFARKDGGGKRGVPKKKKKKEEKDQCTLISDCT